MYTFEPRRYAFDHRTFAYVRVLVGGRLVAIVRKPDPSVGGERPDHWRVDCGEADYEPVVNPGLKKAVCDYLLTEKVSVFWPWKGWNDQNNTETYPPTEDFRVGL